MAKRICIYARVSTGTQDAENQVAQLEAHCNTQGWEIVQTLREDETGKKGRRERSAFNQLFEMAAKRRFDCVLFWALDRFTREGMFKTISYLQELDRCGVSFISYTEPHLNTDNEMVRNILLAVLSSLAKIEAQKISERTKAGLERAKRKGKRLGRRPVDGAVQRKIAQLEKTDMTIKDKAKQAGVSINTYKKYRNKIKEAA
jgi:DNA invertase Pin-like site-specific DNA recombinase